jgi:uncharacterized protein
VIQDPYPWLEAVVAAAEQAAAAEDGPIYRYRWDHVQVVVREAEALAHELGADLEIVTAAAWLHDVVKCDASGVEQEDHAAKGAARARNVLADTGFPPEKVKAVADAIAKHARLYKDWQVEPLEAAILWDADKLSKLGATGALAAIAWSIVRGGADTTPALVRELYPLWLYRRMAASMNTQRAREIAAQRLACLEQFYAHLVAEGWLSEKTLRAQGP